MLLFILHLIWKAASELMSKATLWRGQRVICVFTSVELQLVRFTSAPRDPLQL